MVAAVQSTFGRAVGEAAESGGDFDGYGHVVVSGSLQGLRSTASS